MSAESDHTVKAKAIIEDVSDNILILGVLHFICVSLNVMNATTLGHRIRNSLSLSVLIRFTLSYYNYVYSPSIINYGCVLNFR